ncbi:hypothetical protein BV25DRAFT_1919577 [Artomyces pyxidatus]|uniref:Uncharacterized protein n=1 Tax=Artomyces pyxidatus TaxID=48021 RepID=A0ACB8SP06_9AGAM|nr:hypothetical protein BV25DRAFT_1919577 [Artomyces pyxidatus]
MSTSPTERSEPLNLVSLVLQSKKALQQGEALCSRANQVSHTSAQDAFEVLALDAKIQWISEAVIEQLKLAASVAKSIEERRTKLEKETQAWDTARAQHSVTLDGILESLGAQLVPPDFHENASDDNIFGIQSSDEEDAPPEPATSPDKSPALTIRHSNGNGQFAKEKPGKLDRTKWKTLRDFVDERAIEDALEAIEGERTALDDSLASTATYPVTLQETLMAIRESLPPSSPAVNIETVLTEQEDVSTTMAAQLESLASHYDQMEGALKDIEGGEQFDEDDLQEMVRDTEELPAIISELEDACTSIERSHESLVEAKRVAREYLAKHHTTLDDLEELGEIMSEMLQRQQEVEAQCADRLEGLHENLLSIDHLSQQFTSFRLSFSKLLVEMARRRQYKEAAENIVRGMMAQLEAMSEEERQVRQDFNVEHGAHLPSDICIYIENPPTRWEVVPFDGDTLEILPEVQNDLLEQAQDAIAREDGHGPGNESL